jgi:integrase
VDDQAVPALAGRGASEVLRFEQLNVEMVRQYRIEMSQRLTTRGRLPEPATLNDLHRLLMTFLRWAEDEGYAVDSRMRRLKAPRVPLKEATVLHIARLRDVLAACNPERPQEELIVRMLVGSGVRAAELCGLAVRGPDGLPDLMLDSLDRGRVELRVRWDAGAKGKKSRRVPITPKLAAAIKRYEARHRDHAREPNVLVNDRGLSYTPWGIDQLMDRLEKRVGFHIHAHAFRHTSQRWLARWAGTWSAYARRWATRTMRCCTATSGSAASATWDPCWTGRASSWSRKVLYRQWLAPVDRGAEYDDSAESPNSREGQSDPLFLPVGRGEQND